MKDYKIVAVGSQPREWNGQYGAMKTYYLMLDGEGDKKIQINKKADSPAPQKGEVITGDITEGEYQGFPEYKFKAAPKQGGFGGGGGFKRDDMAIRAQWAIGQAITMELAFSDADRSIFSQQNVQTVAIKLFGMVDKVKAKYEPETPQNGSRDDSDGNANDDDYQDNLAAELNAAFPPDSN